MAYSSQISYSLFTSPFHLISGSKAVRNRKPPTRFCCNKKQYDQITRIRENVEQNSGAGSGRRELLLHTGFAAFSFSQIVSAALAEDETVVQKDFRDYTDDVNKFSIIIPADWSVGAGEGNGINSVIAFFPEGPSSSNVSIVISGLGPDFTRLESFGKVDAFAENLVSGLDRSWQRPPGVVAKLIDCKAANGLYYIEYTLKNPGESQRHLYSALGMANNGWYNRLYTVTGQFIEEEAEKYDSIIEKAVASFRLI